MVVTRDDLPVRGTNGDFNGPGQNGTQQRPQPRPGTAPALLSD